MNNEVTNNKVMNNEVINDKVIMSMDIPIVDIVNNTFLLNPKSECEFNNLMTINALYIFVQNILSINNSSLKGGYKKFNHKKNISVKNKRIKKHNNKKNDSKNNKNKLRKTRKTNKVKVKNIKQLGGFPMNNYIMFFVMFLLFSSVFGIRNVTNSDIRERLEQAYDSHQLFRNNYGTCTSNTLLFLKSIDLATFEELSSERLTRQRGLRSREMDPYLSQYLDKDLYLNKNLEVKMEWSIITHNKIQETNESNNYEDKYINKYAHINEYIEDLKYVLREKRDKMYGTDIKQNIITILNYSSKDSDIGHSVIIWLSTNDDIFIIDPQLFEYGFEIYTSMDTYSEYYKNNFKKNMPANLKLKNIKVYINDNVNFINNRISYLLTSVHGELVDNPLANKKLVYETIKNIEKVTQQYEL